jgi:hypothetical protein
VTGVVGADVEAETEPVDAVEPGCEVEPAAIVEPVDPAADVGELPAVVTRTGAADDEHAVTASAATTSAPDAPRLHPSPMVGRW